MKKLLISLLVIGNAVCAQKNDKNESRVLSKKDRQELVEMLREPMCDMQKSINSFNEVAQQIQNFVVEMSNNDSHSKVEKKLEQIELILQKLVQEVIRQRQVLGNLNDPSVGAEEFTSVEDIDNASLSLISLLKSIFREQLHDDHFIS